MESSVRSRGLWPFNGWARLLNATRDFLVSWALIGIDIDTHQWLSSARKLRSRRDVVHSASQCTAVPDQTCAISVCRRHLCSVFRRHISDRRISPICQKNKDTIILYFTRVQATDLDILQQQKVLCIPRLNSCCREAWVACIWLRSRLRLTNKTVARADAWSLLNYWSPLEYSKCQSLL